MQMAKTYASRATAQRAANRENDKDPQALWVIGNEYKDGLITWFIENLYDLEQFVPHPMTKKG